MFNLTSKVVPGADIIVIENRINNTSNVVRAKNIRFAKRISDMQIGDIAFTVPWAYNPIKGELNTDFTAYPGTGGTIQMKVTCVAIENRKKFFSLEVLDDYEF